MRTVLVFFIGSCLFHTFSHGDSSEKSPVVFSTVIYRHGDRNPVNVYPNDPYSALTYWPEGLGQLTNLGKRQHFSLGKWLRKRYINLLPIEYNVDDIYIQSTDVDRTLMSALSNMAGFFPPKNSQIWDNYLPDWQPIPIHTIPEKEDNVLAGKKTCTKYNSLMKELEMSQYFRQIAINNTVLYNNLSALTGSNVRSIVDLNNLYDTLFIETDRNLTLPTWTTNYYPEPLQSWAALSFKIACYNAQLTRLKIGLLLHEIYERMVNKSLGNLEPDRKMWIYSAHDITIVNVLMALGVFDGEPPPYTSTILIELSQQKGKYGLSIYYKKHTNDDEATLLNLPCGKFCLLSDFFKSYQPIMLSESEWYDECENDAQPRLGMPTIVNSNIVVFITAGILVVLLLFASVATALAYVNKNDDTNNKFYFRLDGMEH